MTDKDGQIVGKLATARLSSDEKADMRRAEFRVIETGGAIAFLWEYWIY